VPGWLPTSGRSVRDVATHAIPDETQMLVLARRPGAMLRSGQIATIVSQFEGLAAAPTALQTVFRTATSYVGKRVIRIA
jgi:NADPH-dependent curcumin reductase CurA